VEHYPTLAATCHSLFQLPFRLSASEINFWTHFIIPLPQATEVENISGLVFPMSVLSAEKATTALEISKVTGLCAGG